MADNLRPDINKYIIQLFNNVSIGSIFNSQFGSRAVDGKRFLESNVLPRFQEPKVRLGYVKVPRIEELINKRNLIPSKVFKRLII